MILAIAINERLYIKRKAKSYNYEWARKNWRRIKKAVKNAMVYKGKHMILENSKWYELSVMILQLILLISIRQTMKSTI